MPSSASIAAPSRPIAINTASAGALRPPVAAAPAWSAQFFLQQLIHLLGVGLALGRLHDLTHLRIESFVLAGPVLLDVIGVGGPHFVDYRADCAASAFLVMSLGLDVGYRSFSGL